MEAGFINHPSNDIPRNLTTSKLAGNNARDFHRTLPGYQPTPLHRLPGLAKRHGIGALYIKDESHRFGLNAFKGLGASYAVHQQLTVHPDITTFCTATDGNHGRAVAWAARMAGKQAVVFVPGHTAQARIRAIEAEGAKVIRVEGHYDETVAFAEATSRREGWQLVQDTAWEQYEAIPAQIMAGYLTHFGELEDSLHPLPHPAIDVVFLQAGVGSWAAAGIWYYLNRYGTNRPKIVMVEPYESDGILESLKQGSRAAPTGNHQTIMAGLNCGIPSMGAWDLIQAGADAAVKIKDAYAEQAMRQLYFPAGDDPRITAGETGAAGLAGLLAVLHEEDLQEVKTALQIGPATRILCFNTEGDTDPDNFRRIVFPNAI